IHTVCHLGRHIPAHLRTALELGEPPGFGGVTCSVAGCGRRHGLEWDHEDPLAHAGPTSMENLSAKCWGHHQDKTAQDRRAGLLDGVLRNLEDRAPP
ncbi:MAG: HNH endonuclease, partial [Acidimicrobiia bacterium]|nr:HNH endonuclease [Acidimicrobiia bacterium]